VAESRQALADVDLRGQREAAIDQHAHRVRQHQRSPTTAPGTAGRPRSGPVRRNERPERTQGSRRRTASARPGRGAQRVMQRQVRTQPTAAPTKRMRGRETPARNRWSGCWARAHKRARTRCARPARRRRTARPRPAPEPAASHSAGRNKTTFSSVFIWTRNPVEDRVPAVPGPDVIAAARATHVEAQREQQDQREPGDQRRQCMEVMKRSRLGGPRACYRPQDTL